MEQIKVRKDPNKLAKPTVKHQDKTKYNRKKQKGAKDELHRL